MGADFGAGPSAPCTTDHCDVWKLPSEPNPTLGPGGEILPETNPWAVRWMADLEELEPYDERVVIQRMGRDERALFLDRELNGCHDVTIAVAGCRGPTVGFSGRGGTNNVRLGLSRSRLLQRTSCGITDNGDGVSVGDHQSVSSVPCGLWGQKSGSSSSPAIPSSWVLS